MSQADQDRAILTLLLELHISSKPRVETLKRAMHALWIVEDVESMVKDWEMILSNPEYQHEIEVDGAAELEQCIGDTRNALAGY